ncbi:transcriptional regulator LysR family [Caballeronia insecticola]|uniref:Transcriptional regulator LysR family n=1 Tax=Caballeronia insecticola TaxID=758793 RepID=R4X1T5_9BURK|nr:transcriptional regulator LysR family [Caballeronia insecticola]
MVEHRNFTRAAEALHVSQPTLSQQIRQLEDSLGAQLLDRSARTIQLTDAGVVYAEFAKRALRDLDDGKRAIHDVRELTRGTLRLAITPTFTAYLVGPLLEKYHRRYPGLTISVNEMPQDRMEAMLNDDTLDAGIAFHETQLPEIEAHALFSEELALMVGKSHALARKGTRLDIGKFAETPLVLLNDSFVTRQWIDRYCRQQGVIPRVAIEVNSINAVMAIVQRSTLATLLPAPIAQEHSQLRIVGLEPALPQRTAALLMRKGAYRSAATEAFVELVREEFDVAGTRRR